MDDWKTFFKLMKACPEDFTYTSSANGYYKVSAAETWSAAGPKCQNLDGRKKKGVKEVP